MAQGRTAYTTVAEDGTVRMALHPMECAPLYGTRVQRDCYDSVERFPFRVVYLDEDEPGEWLYSCRGTDVSVEMAGEQVGFNFDGDPDTQAYSYWHQFHAWDDESAAIRWLLEGEK